MWILLPSFLYILSIEGKEVCSLSFNYGLSSLFIERDSSLQVAQDELELCHLCNQVTRLGFLYANLPQARNSWELILKANACAYIQQSRLVDCKKLTASIIDAEEDFFLSDAARFTLEELELSRVELSQLLEQKSQTLCTNIRCCKKKRPSKKEDEQAILEPLPAPESGSGEIRNELRNLNSQRLTLQNEKDALDKLQISFESAKRKLAAEEDAVQKQEQDLDTREDTLTKEGQNLRKQYEQNRTKLQLKEKDLQAWETELEKLETELEADQKNEKQNELHQRLQFMLLYLVVLLFLSPLLSLQPLLDFCTLK